MNASLHHEIMESYRVQREQNAREEKRRLREVCAKDGELSALIARRHEMILEGVRSVFSDVPGGDLGALMTSYNEKIAARLARDGFPPDYLAPVFTCEKCRDTGYVGENARHECVCYLKKAAEMAGGADARDQTFENFDEAVFPDEEKLEGSSVTQRGLMRLVRGICEEYADDFPRQRPGDLLLYGGSGLGKTYLLSCIAARARERGHDAFCVTAFSALSMLRSAYFSRSDEAASLFDAELLLLDDLGMEPLMENITIEQIYNLLNERRKRGLSTVISTNLSIRELKARYTERVSSRLLDAGACRVIHLMGRDVRLIRRMPEKEE